MSASTRDTAGAPAEAVDLIALLDMLWRARALIGKTVLGAFALGLAYALLATPIYRSELMIQIDSNAGSVSNQLLGSLSDFLGVKSSDDAEMQILRSRRVIGAAIDDARYDIVVRPLRLPLLGHLFAGRAGVAAPRPALGGYVWGEASLRVDRFDLPRALYGRTFTVTALAQGRYRVAVPGMAKQAAGVAGAPLRLDTPLGVAILQIGSIDAAENSRFELQRQPRLKAIADVQERIGVIAKAKDAGVITVTLDGADPARTARYLNALGDAYVHFNSAQKAEQAQKSLDFLQQQLPALKRELETAEDALLAFRDRHEVIDLGESAKLKLGQMVALQTRLSLLGQERRARLQDLQPGHEAIQAIDSQAGGLTQELQMLETQVKTLPDTEQALMRLTREARVSAELYTAMLNSAQQLRLLKAGKVGNVHVVDAADVEEKPVRPRRALVVLGSLVLGLIAGIAAAFGRALWRGPVTDPRELERRSGNAVVSLLPLRRQPGRHRWSWRGPSTPERPLALTHAHDPVVESLRGLAIELQLKLLEARNNVVIVTGATAGIGKSFVAANLAIVLAQAGRRVLLLDGDLRRGALAEAFGLRTAPGMTQQLRGDLLLPPGVIQHSGIQGLDVIGAGAKVKDPIELLHRPRLPSWLAATAAAYDIVLVDTAPVLPVADAVLLARQAGLVYAVARYGVSSEAELAEMQARLDRAGVPLAGIILNGIQADLRNAAYGSYRYSYEPQAGEATA
ncbi:tyrosine-protein kinase Etk/Wzc [Dyella sp. SG562]|uniref:GNVR domain-containing protein n=1 Tax=Dyella sp. SG562 TaxID=2587017 RepID=UPI0014217778|nr:GNVR domain-containing protein [Dyella sp. SG562]NII72874.1 tyrosine-protein kinase Etk/Wzc [Dyella sp. SG562]